MRHPLRFLIAFLVVAGPLLFGGAGPTMAQQTPFGVAAPTGQRSAPPARTAAPTLFGKLWVWIQTTQRDLHRQLAGAIRRIKGGEGISAIWLLAGLSFFYGVVHAAGPGHGKAVISSYVLANEKTVRRGIVLSFLASLVQAMSAVVLVTIFAVLLNAAGVQIKDSARHMETASYGLIALVGAWLLWSQVRRIWFGAGAHHHSHGHDHGDGDACHAHAHMPDARQIEKAADWKSAAAIVFAVGLRPCTGAILVLVFAFANGLFLAGIGATFAMALGTAITVSALAVLAVVSREVAVRLAGPGSRWADRVFNSVALAGAVLVLGLGIVLFAGSLGPARPF